jgi:flagellar FliL protein
MSSTTAQLKPAGDAAAAAPAKKSKKKLIIIAVVALVLLGGGYKMLGGKKKDAAPPPPKPGAVLALDAITINLSGGHYLKLGLALQATKSAKEDLDGSKALDLAIVEFSNRSVAELSSNKSLAKLKADLLKKVIKAYETDVMDLYFTEFVMQ